MISLLAERALTHGLRVGLDELRGVAAGVLDGVDLLGRPREDEDIERAPSISEPVTPLEVLETSAVVSRDFRDLSVWDRTRKYDWRQYGFPSDKSRGQSRGVIAWDKLTTVVLHTAGINGMHPDRWLGVPCHVAVADDGTIVLCHRLNAYLWHAHAANRFSMGLEIAGDKRITAAQVEPARAAVRYMVEERRRHAGGPMYIMPHRHSSRSRASDCDAPIWDAVGVWAMRELDLQLGPVVGDGLPLPFAASRARGA